MERNTAEMPVVMPEARMWKLHVNAAIRHVPLHFDSSQLVAASNWIAKKGRLCRRPLGVGKAVADHECDRLKENQL
jgi:hypothetical protein